MSGAIKVGALNTEHFRARSLDATAPGADFFSDFVKSYDAAAKASGGGAGGTPALSEDATTGLGIYTQSGFMGYYAINQDERSQFAAILDKAYSSGGMDDPQAFLKSLSPSDLNVLEQMHDLPDPIDVNGISKEGAYNLLLPTNKAVDFNNDGIVVVGDIQNIVFPPVNAPKSVVSAWDQATAGLSAEDKLQASAQFTPAIMKDGSLYENRDFDPTNVDDYKNVVNNYLDFLRHPTGIGLSREQYARDFPVYTELQTLLGG